MMKAKAQRRRRWFLAVLLCSVAMIVLPRGGFAFQVELEVTERAGVSRSGLPVTMGVPFAQGTIYSDQDVQIAGVPGQFKALSSWQDGSVKWLLCDFQADVPAYGNATYYLSDGTGDASGTPLMATEYADSIVVVTGPLRFVVNRTNFNLFQRLWLDLNDNGLFEGDEEMISPHGQDGPIVRMDSGDQYFAALDGNVSVELEEEGPLRVAILAEGWHLNASGERGLDFTVRIHAYSGQSFVRVFYTFYNRQSTSIGAYWEPPPPAESYIDVEDISLCSHINLQGTASYAFGGAGSTVHSGTLEGTESAYIYSYGTVTPDDLHYLVGGSGSGSGDRARGWTDISDSRWGLTTGIRQFWQHHPKGIEVSADGEIWVRMIPEYYDSFPINPDDQWTSADLIYCGAAKTHEMLYYFHPGGHSAAQSENMALSFDNPLYAVAPPRWYASSRAFGQIVERDYSLFKPEYLWIVQAYEDKIDDMVDTILENREESYWSAKNEYGMWNYGDSYQSQWSNMQYDTPFSLYTQFARTADMKYFDLATDQCRHYRDVDIVYHMGDTEPGSLREAFVGSARRLPNTNHALGWDTDFMGDISLKGPGLILHYFFTGDRQSLYGGKMQADYVRNSALRYQRDYIFCGPRRFGMGLEALLYYYEATGDMSYLNNGVYHLGDISGTEKASAYTLAKKINEHQSISPRYPEVWAVWGSWGVDCDDGLKFESVNFAGCSWQACLAWGALRHYYEITADTVARDDILRGMAWMCDPTRVNLWNEEEGFFEKFDPIVYPSDNKGRDDAGGIVGVLGFAYEHTGDISYIDKAISALNVAVSGVSGATTDPKLLSQRSKYVPQLFYYLTTEFGDPDSIPPNSPTNLHATGATEHSIPLAWTPPSPASDGDGASSYSIFRDSQPIGTSLAPQFDDTGLAENSSFDYAVYAKDNAGNLSLSAATGTFATLADVTRPTISTLNITGSASLEIIFSEPVEEASAEDETNYLIDNGISIVSADLQADLETVRLTTSPHEDGITYTLTVNDVRDRAASPNTILPNSSISYQFYLQLQIADLNRTNYQDTYLDLGEQYYVDRTFTLVDVPEDKTGVLWIKTANDDKMNSEDVFLTFTINLDADVYIGYDHRASSVPNWISENFTNSGQEVEVSDVGASPMQLWVKHFSVGPVSLGGNMAAGADGAESMYTVLLHAEGAVVDTLGPQISNVDVSGITATASTITWVTDEAADSKVEYGLSAGNYIWSVNDVSWTTNHQLELSELTQNTTYHYRVISEDQFGNISASGDDTFTTQSQDSTPPQISQMQAQILTDSTAQITWVTDELADSQVEYGLDISYGYFSSLDLTMVHSHDVTISLPPPSAKRVAPPVGPRENSFKETRGVRSDGRPQDPLTMSQAGKETIFYHFRVLSRDASGNLALSADNIFTRESQDQIPPVIANLQIGAISDTSAQIRWETDEPARSALNYGLVEDEYTWSLTDSALTMEHQFDVRGLSPATTYHIQAQSQDAAGNWSIAPDTTFATKHAIPGQPGKPQHYDD